MRNGLILVPVLALAACGETAGWNPNHGFGATPYGNYQREREAALMGLGAPPRVIPVTLPEKAPTTEQLASGAWTATRGNTDLTPARTRPRVAATAAGGTAQAQAPLLNRYADVNLHAPGTRVWPRPGAPAGAAACARFPTPAEAQTAFLTAGGPQADGMGLDPDGDGYACGWEPAPYRSARR